MRPVSSPPPKVLNRAAQAPTAPPVVRESGGEDADARGDFDGGGGGGEESSAIGDAIDSIFGSAKAMRGAWWRQCLIFAVCHMDDALIPFVTFMLDQDTSCGSNTCLMNMTLRELPR